MGKWVGGFKVLINFDSQETLFDRLYNSHRLQMHFTAETRRRGEEFFAFTEDLDDLVGVREDTHLSGKLRLLKKVFLTL